MSLKSSLIGPLGPIWFAIFVILFWNLGAVPLTDVDEGAFAEATREMWLRRDFISPWLLDQPRFDKPVLIHWLQMASMLVFGFNSFGARFPSAIAGLFWILAIGLWAKTVASNISKSIDVEGVFHWALVISASSIAIPALSRSSTADALLNALICWAIYFHYRALTDPILSRALKRARYAAGLIGLGILTKGPIAVLIPGIALIIGWWALWEQEARYRLKRFLLDSWSWIIVISIALPWYWLQYWAQGDAFIQGFFGVHNVGRFINAMHGFSAGPWYYPVWTILALFPFSPVFIYVLFTVRKNTVLINRHLWPCWGNLLFVLIFFSFSATKLPHYAFYGLPGLIVLLAIFLATLDSKNATLSPGTLTRDSANLRRLMLARFVIVILAIAALLLPWILEIFTDKIKDPYIKVVAELAIVLIREESPLIFGLFIISLLAFIIRQWSVVLALYGLSFAIIIHLVVIPSGIEAYRGPIRDLASEIKKTQLAVSTWRMSSPSLSFELGQVIHGYDLDGPQNVVVLEKNFEKFRAWLVSRRKHPVHITVLWSRGGICLVRVEEN